MIKSIFKFIKSQIHKILGIRYVVNHNTLEIHMISNLKHNCHVADMTNKSYVSSSKQYLENGYNGCRWCYKETDTDKNG